MLNLVLLASLVSMFCGSRAEVVSRQFLFPGSVERMLATGGSISLNLLFLASLVSMLCGSRAEVVSQQFLFPDSVELLLVAGA